jgi:hypothetical protein
LGFASQAGQAQHNHCGVNRDSGLRDFDAALGKPVVLALQLFFESLCELFFIEYAKLELFQMLIERPSESGQDNFHQLFRHDELR